MPVSRAACMTRMPCSRLIRSKVRHDPSASRLTWMPLAPRATLGMAGAVMFLPVLCVPGAQRAWCSACREHALGWEGAGRHNGARHRLADSDDLLGALVAQVPPGRRSHLVGLRFDMRPEFLAGRPESAVGSEHAAVDEVRGGGGPILPAPPPAGPGEAGHEP